MAGIGLSKLLVAKYSNTGTTVTYSGCTTLGKATSFSSEIELSEDNDLYADNGIAETDDEFESGTLTIGTDNLSAEVSALILGITVETDGSLHYGNNLAAPYLGFGTIVRKKVNNVLQHRAVLYRKIKFSIPSDSAETKGKTIEWQTPELEATILRDDTENEDWLWENTFTTEAAAEAYLKGILDPEADEDVDA